VMKRKKAINSLFLKTLFPEDDCDGKKSTPMEYGKTCEVLAKRAYTSTSSADLHLHDCGFVINPEFPFLGASPDAKVCKDGVTGIVEIKCPYTARNLSIPEAVHQMGDKSNFCLELVGNGEVHLKQNHEYYYQVQGQLMITGTPFCDFVVYTEKDLFIETILPDTETMNKMLDKLVNTYKHVTAQSESSDKL